MSSHNESLVLVEEENHIMTLRLNRPDKLNAVNDDLIKDLIKSIKNIKNTGNSLLITGSGRATCAGRDTNLVTQPEWDGEAATSTKLLELLQNFPQPTALAGKGAVVGIGFAVAMECDFVILGEDTHFSFPEINYEIENPGRIGQFAKYTGPRVAKELIMTGEPINPERAYNLGLVNNVVPEEEVEETTYNLLGDIMRKNNNIITNYISESRMKDI